MATVLGVVANKLHSHHYVDGNENCREVNLYLNFVYGQIWYREARSDDFSDIVLNTLGGSYLSFWSSCKDQNT